MGLIDPDISLRDMIRHPPQEEPKQDRCVYCNCIIRNPSFGAFCGEGCQNLWYGSKANRTEVLKDYTPMYSEE